MPAPEDTNAKYSGPRSGAPRLTPRSTLSDRQRIPLLSLPSSHHKALLPQPATAATELKCGGGSGPGEFGPSFDSMAAGWRGTRRPVHRGVSQQLPSPSRRLHPHRLGRWANKRRGCVQCSTLHSFHRLSGHVILWCSGSPVLTMILKPIHHSWEHKKNKVTRNTMVHKFRPAALRSEH